MLREGFPFQISRTRNTAVVRLPGRPFSTTDSRRRRHSEIVHIDTLDAGENDGLRVFGIVPDRDGERTGPQGRRNHRCVTNSRRTTTADGFFMIRSLERRDTAGSAMVPRDFSAHRDSGFPDARRTNLDARSPKNRAARESQPARRLHGFAEDLSVEIDVGFGGGRRDQRHVVERRHQDAAVQRGQVHVAVELGIDRGGGLGAVSGRRRPEPVLGAAAEPGDVPRQAVLRDHAARRPRRSVARAGSSARRPPRSGRSPASRASRRARARCRRACRRCRRCRRSSRGRRPRIRAASSARHAVDGGGHAAGDRLADREHVGLEAVGARVAAGPGADRVGLVDDQQRPGPPRRSRAAPRGTRARAGRCRCWSGRARPARRRRRPARAPLRARARR